MLECFFVNVADVGFWATIAGAWKRLPTHFSHSINFSLRTVEGLRCLLTHRSKLIKLRVGDEVKAIRSCTVVEADGDIIGESPASFWVIPSTLTVVV